MPEPEGRQHGFDQRVRRCGSRTETCWRLLHNHDPGSCANPCMNRTQPPVLWSIPHRIVAYRAGLSYTMKATNAIMLGTALEAAPRPASQTWTIRSKLLFSETLAPDQAVDGLFASLPVTIWRRKGYRALKSDTIPNTSMAAPPPIHIPIVCC
jgi:hypothetical protein